LSRLPFDGPASGTSKQDALTERPSTEVSASELRKEFELQGQIRHRDLVSWRR
jgi:hypothetical protein